MMKRLALISAALVGGAFWLGIAGAPAFADNGPHFSSAGNLTVDRCASCHRAHTAQASYLLRQAQPALCYTCHGSAAGGASTDVYDGVGYQGFERGSGGAALRGGGFAYALIDSGSASIVGTTKTVPTLTGGRATTSAHTVDGSLGTAWGNGAISATPNAGTQIGLTCGSCHDPHGNGNYRLLRPIPVDSGATTGVTIPDSPTKQYTTTNFWSPDDPNSPAVTTPIVAQNRDGSTSNFYPSVFIANISAWCSQCHTRYLAGRGSYGANSGDATFMYRHRTDQNYKAPGANCITCHVAHGSDAQMSGTASSKVGKPDGSDVNTSDLLRVDNRGTCNMCHSV